MSPGQYERAQFELAAAGEALQAARLLLDQGLYRDAASRLYYAVFHATRAVLVSRGLNATTHSGQRTVFTQAFGAAPIIDRLLALRLEADYASGEFEETGEQLRALLEEAENFVERCRKLVSEAVAEGDGDPEPPVDR